MTTKLGVLGSIAFDNIFTAERVPRAGERVWGKLLGRYLGGMAANQAIEAARYLEHVEIIGKVGADLEGEALREGLTARRVGTRLLLRDETLATGQSYMYMVGDEYFSIVARGANCGITPREAEAAVAGLGGGVLMASLEVNPEAVHAALLAARGRGMHTILIPQPPEACPPDLPALADTLILNRREAQNLLGEVAADAAEAAACLERLRLAHRRVVVTLGSAGAALFQDGHAYASRSLAVEVIDAVGAGDAFAGAFIAADLMGLPPARALAMGCIAGALSVASPGSQASAHTRSDMLRLLEEHENELIIRR